MEFSETLTVYIISSSQSWGQHLIFMYNKPSCNDHYAFLPNFIFREYILLSYLLILNYPSQKQVLESREPYWKHNTYGPILHSLHAVPVSLQECEYDRHACGGGDCPAAPQSGASWTDAQPVQQDEGRGRPLAGRKCLGFNLKLILIVCLLSLLNALEFFSARYIPWNQDLARWKNRRRSISQDLIKKEEERKMMEQLLSGDTCTSVRRRSIKTYREIVADK